MAFKVSYTIQAKDAFTPTTQKVTASLGKAGKAAKKAEKPLSAFQGSPLLYYLERMDKSLGRIDKSLKSTSRKAKKTKKALSDVGKAPAKDAFTPFTKRISHRLKKVTKDANKAKLSMGSLGRVVPGVGAAMAAAFGSAKVVSTIASFGEKMSRVEAVTGATADQMGLLRKQAKDLGSTTIFSASQAAEGMGYLAQAGLEVNEIIGTMPAMLNLAAAGQLGLGEAADIALSVMAPFGLVAKDATHVSNALAVAATSSKTGISELGQAMVKATPLATIYNQSMEDTTAMLGSLASAGLKSSLAGTGLKSAMRDLTKITPKSMAAFKALGLTVQDVNPITKSATDIFALLQERLNGVEDATVRSNIVKSIFMDESVTAASILIQEAKATKILADKIRDSEGAAKDMSDTMQNNLMGDYKAMKSAMEGLVLGTGDKGLTGALRSATQEMTGFFRVVGGDKSQVSQMSEEMVALAEVTGAVGTAFGGLFKVIGIGFGEASKAITTYGHALGKILIALDKVAVATDPMTYIHKLKGSSAKKGAIERKEEEMAAAGFAGTAETSAFDRYAEYIQSGERSRYRGLEAPPTGRIDMNINGAPAGSTVSTSSNNLKLGTNMAYQ